MAIGYHKAAPYRRVAKALRLEDTRSEQIPPEMEEPLLRECELARRIIQTRMARETDPMGGYATDVPP
jgi:hypothetical protein